ncbi:MAG TPA: EAL domain-containing protein [Rhizomicrobium sp.]|nr:EAL domain-containing protein [Rhizomicrobium sp.]
MTRAFAIAAALIAGLMAAASAAMAAQGEPALVDFASPDAVLEIQDAMVPYHGPSGTQPDGSNWYLIKATNSAVRPASRVLQATQTPSFAFLPRPTRPAIVGVASSDSAVSIENLNAYGRRAYRVIIPPATSVEIVVQVANAAQPPSLRAWTEPALAAHNRQFAIFTTAVWALIGGAALMVSGLAVMLGHAPARWAALTLVLILLERLSETGLFDGSLATGVGGPYGLTAMFAGFSLAAGARLADAIVPLSEIRPRHVKWLKRSEAVIIVLAILAYIGVPGTVVAVDALVLFGAGAIAAYLIYRGILGSQAAKVSIPSALVFACVTIASALAMLSSTGDSLATSAAGSFAAAGSILLALAIAAGEGIAVLPFQSVAAVAEPPSGRDVRSSLEAITASNQGIFDLDFARDNLHLSREAALLIGLPETNSRVRHGDFIARIYVEDRDVYRRALGDYRKRPGLGFRVEFRMRGPGARVSWFELRATMLGGEDVASRCVGLLADVTARKSTEAEALDRTLKDPLTGLGNRVSMMEELEQRSPHFANTTFALLDVDRFKSIHASLGDTGGDGILSQMAERLTKRFEGVAQVFRVGGDAFAMIFSDGSKEPTIVGAELIEACSAPYRLDGREVFAPASVGVALGRDASDPLELLKNTELALMHAKQLGGGCARAYSRELETLAPGDAVTLESELRRAIEESQIVVHYQPIMHLDDGAIAGFEALLRWNHPTRGLVTPTDFIAHSEETGTIVTLGRIALESAAQDLSHWQRYFPLAPPLFVSVNVSRRQLRDAEFGVFLGSVMSKAHLAPETLKLEVTESVIAGNPDLRSSLEHCRALGAGITIDDFGTGASSLSQLKDLPFDTIKIDQSFLAKHKDPQAKADGEVVLKSIIALAHDLKRTIIVEGVEREPDAAWLKALGCEYAQGYFFSKPLPSADALNFIAMHFDLLAARSGVANVAGKP